EALLAGLNRRRDPLPSLGCGNRRLSVGQRFVDPPSRDPHVRGVDVVADVSPSELGGSYERRTAAHERIEHEVAFERIEPDELLRQLNWEGRRVTDAAGA